ncbi:MAG: hypothetical protein KDD34_09270 [Bdellovibrionales bacterium]|nr:hypothetical protein [Bdellovibrionales bacterium]
MKKLMILTALILGAQFSHADGFKCLSTDGELQVQVYNHVMPEEGTRTVAVMVLSNPQVQEGRQTIAKFSAENATLSSGSMVYTAQVDLRFRESRTKGEYLAGTRLGYVDSLNLNVDFSYSHPVKEGTLLPAVLTVTKRSGEVIEMGMVCSRYLKN